MACILMTECKFMHGCFQVPFTNRNHGCGGKCQNDERHSHLQERPPHPGHIMQTMDSQTVSLSIYAKKDAGPTWNKKARMVLSCAQVPTELAKSLCHRRPPIPKKAANKKKRTKTPPER